MDDTQLNRASDAAATRKRRSSILKSQRPPRTPFSELEFNVATPTDSAKSRRVSFSRQTGVAEFVANEATTTWKNFYEEHNKSLESSGNDSGSKQSVGHLGKRVFDQQFEEVEADFIGTLNTGPSINISTSLNNFEQQLASLECTDNIKLTAPHNNFELSAFTTNHTRLFDELAIPCGEVTDPIDINFSAVQQIGEVDDLDEIQKDLKQNFGNAFQRQNISEYIEVDLNMTHVMKNEDDMSITDTVHSPKVQDVSKISKIDKDWAVDKENIAINPYAAPREAENFAINEESDKVLVFDGKRLTLLSERAEKENRQTLLPNAPEKAPQRKTIVLNVNDDLPNFIDDLHMSNASGFIGISDLKRNLIVDDMSITEPLEMKQRTVVYDHDLGNISITQAVPSNIIPEDKRDKILYEDNGNISVTQAIPTNIIAEKRRTIVHNDSNISITQAVPTNVQKLQNEKRKTILFDDGNISVTQAIPTNIIAEQRRTITHDNSNISITQAVPNVQEPQNEKRKTILFDDGNISVTQAIPTNIIAEQRRTITHDNSNISITQAVPNVQEPQNEKRKTILFDDGNISVTQAIPTNIIAEQRRTITHDNSNISITQAVPNVQEPQNEKRKTILFDDGNISMTQALPVNILPENTAKRRTIVYEDNAGNFSITQAVPNILITEAKAEKRRTIVYEDDTGNISVTQAIPSNIILAENATDRRRTVVFESDTGNISVTQAVPSSLILQEQTKNSQAKIINSLNKTDNRRRTIVYENDTGNLSITQAVPNQLIQEISARIPSQDANVTDTEEATKRKTILFDNDNSDISMTQAVSLNQVICVIRNEKELAIVKENQIENENQCKNDANKRRTVLFDNDDADISMTQALPVNVIQNILNKTNANKTESNKRRTVVFENDDADISMTQAVINPVKPGFVQNLHDDLEDALNEALHCKDGGKSRRTIVFEKENVYLNCQDKYTTSSVPNQNNVKENEKRRTIVFDDDICMTQALPVNIIEEMKDMNAEIKTKDSNASLDFSMSDMNIEEKAEKYEIITRKSFTELEPVNSVTKPIPSNLLTINSENKSKSVLEDIQSSVVESSTIGVSKVLVYQAALTKRTEQGDSKSQEPIVIENDEKISSTSSKIANDVKQTDDKITSSSNTDVNDVKETESAKDQDLQVEAHVENKYANELQSEGTEQNQSVINNDQSEASSQMSKSILNDLLDMSSAEIVEDKGLMTQEAKETDSEQLKAKPTEASSNDTLFFITKDGDDEAQIQTDNVPQITEHSPLPLEYKNDPNLVTDLQNKLEVLKEAMDDDRSPKNRHYEKILSSDLDKAKLKENKSFKTANDTNELLEMLSDLTDKTMTRKLDPHLEEDEEQPEPILVKGHLALENKSEAEPEPRRLSFAPRRQSIVMSREDLLNNISMAGAALKSRLDFDDSDLEDTVKDSPEEKPPMKSIRLSNEVVKTLHFDESISESSIHTDTKMTPLKKTAFGETSYMQEHKSKVIPDYLKNVSDGIKELMDDLVKPNADVLPFDSVGIDKSVRKVPSTCSTQIQANLVTSSQIDINAGLYSNPDSVYDVQINKISSVDMINDAVNRSVSRALKSPIKSATTTHTSEKSFDSKMEVSTTDARTIFPSKPTEQSLGRVLIFDHNNPLNNILLAPDTFTEVHKYNPGNSTETICVSQRSNSVQMSINEKDYEVERVSTQYNVGSLLHSVQQSGDASSGKIAESQSKVSNISKPMSIDQSTDAKLNDVKDTEVNTLIAMKGNRELLDASSSLTLVDDALARSTFDVDIDTRTTTSQEDMESPVKVIYSLNRDDLLSVKLDSDFTSNDDLDDRKPKKRIYSPAKRDKHKHCTMSSLDVTPKPTTKMQKLSESPHGFNPIDVSHSAEKPTENDKKKKSPRKTKSKKPGTSLTVQQLMTEYNVGPIDHEALDEQIKEVLRDPRSDSSSVEPTQSSQSDVQDCKSLDMVSSFTSSKNLRDDRSGVTSPSSKVSTMDWRPDLIDAVSSKNLSECDSSVNVVAKIDMLPFMGSHECEWESSSGDTWSFRLLHARLRLVVRLAHRHHNAARTSVRADTPVRGVSLDLLPHDTKNSLAVLCVNFAAETMRYFISRGCATAGDVPQLARRCAACARLAARWGRAMSEARASLAYCLAPDATLTLKVANVPLRCVWEVSMRLELVVGDAREAPWVRAGGVRVRRLLPPPPPRAPGAERLPRALRQLPRDWSHAPHTIWRIFKYLKHKTRDDDELFMEM